MTDALHKVKDVAETVAHPVAHPVEVTKELAEEVERGESPRTPLLALTGVAIMLGIVAGLLIAIGLVVYFASR